MQYYKCKCGKHESWGSMPPFQCAGCKECGTTLATSPQLHSAPKPHDFVPTKVETDLGEETLHRCRYCGRTRTDVLKEEADGFFILNGKKHLTIGPIHGIDVRVKLPPECNTYELQDESGYRFSSHELVPSGTIITAVPPSGFVG